MCLTMIGAHTLCCFLFRVSRFLFRGNDPHHITLDMMGVIVSLLPRFKQSLLN
jgi:cytochrome bd-type quinol oxidase subunit 2